MTSKATTSGTLVSDPPLASVSEISSFGHDRTAHVQYDDVPCHASAAFGGEILSVLI